MDAKKSFFELPERILESFSCRARGEVEGPGERQSRWRICLGAYLACCYSCTPDSDPIVVGKVTNIISHFAHQACGKVQEHDLEIYDATISRGIIQTFLDVYKDRRQNIFNESL